MTDTTNKKNKWYHESAPIKNLVPRVAIRGTALLVPLFATVSRGCMFACDNVYVNIPGQSTSTRWPV